MNKEAGLLLGLIVGAVLLWMSLQAPEVTRTNCPDDSCSYTLIESLSDVPPQLRTPNHSPYGYGSCVHVSTCTMLKWRGEHKLAEWWYNNYNSGEYEDRLIRRLDAAGLKFAYTNTGDVRFLEWAARNRVVIGIFYFRLHAVNLVDLDESYATLLDNNRVDRYIRIPRREFIKNWQEKYGGFAWAILDGQSPPPYPTW